LLKGVFVVGEPSALEATEAALPAWPAISLRQQGTSYLSVVRFFARRAKNELQKEEKYRCERAIVRRYVHK
jgi:hypothetical protein